MEKKPKPIPDSSLARLPAWLFVDAVRYAIGRQSYQVGVTADWLCAYWQHLPAEARTIIRRDVEEAFTRDDVARKHESTRGCQSLPLGSDCDRASWEQVRALWKESA